MRTWLLLASRKKERAASPDRTSEDADALEEEPQGPGARLQRPWAHREAPQARRRPWKRWRPAPSPHQLRQVPSGVLREGRYALLPSPEPRCEPVLPCREFG